MKSIFSPIFIFIFFLCLFYRKALESLGIPCFLGGMSRGMLGNNSPLHIRQNRRDALKDADLVLLAGGKHRHLLNSCNMCRIYVLHTHNLCVWKVWKSQWISKLWFHAWKSQLIHFIHTQVMELFIKYLILWKVGKCGNTGFCIVLVLNVFVLVHRHGVWFQTELRKSAEQTEQNHRR